MPTSLRARPYGRGWARLHLSGGLMRGLWPGLAQLDDGRRGKLLNHHMTADEASAAIVPGWAGRHDLA